MWFRRYRLVHLALALLILAACDAGTRDTLIMTDGAMKTGTLAGCAGDVCTFDGAPVPRAGIRFIGLDAELPVPAPRDPLRDEVHFHDVSIHPGPLIAIDATSVVTAAAVHRRTDVAWIWLTLAPGGLGNTAPPTAASETDAEEEEDRPTYAWAGTIKVENRYGGPTGHHLWQAEYRVKLLEVPTDGNRPGRQIGVSFPTNNLEPVELTYDIAADQNWNGGPYRVKFDGGGRVVNGDVTMRGRAAGRIEGQTLVESRVLGGDVVRLDAPAATPQEPAAGIATEAEYRQYQQNYFSPAEPGWYFISIGFVGHHMDHGGQTGPPARLLSIYDGIVRGGLEPPFFSDPYKDFVHWIPAYGTGVGVVGRLDDPDQAEVRGALAFARDIKLFSGERITIEWSFTRTREPDQP